MENANPKPYLPVNHHSIGDWDFSSGNWAFSPAQFISPPTSVKCTSGVINILHNWYASRRLPEGRLVGYIYNGYDGHMPGFIFRSQQLIGSALVMSRYFASYLDRLHWVLQSYIGDIATTIDTWNVLTDLDTWYRWRVTFWISQTLKCEPALFVKLEREEAGEWVDYGTLEDTANLYADSDVNRYGICLYGTYCYQDNTELWVPG